ncbi:MAG TPA: acyl-CoA dehydrogenase family protein, partial [Candidatus Acidoferrales bacterium]|nr:acyl-CoA dehydrogenase family protein [Candidatus Acidoferrales bacterium]
MDFELTEEQLMVRDMTRAYAEKELKPIASRMDHDSVYPQEQLKKLGEMGLMGVFVSEEFGGGGMDRIAYVAALEEISKAWASLGVIMSVNNSLVCGPLAGFGTEEQKKRYLRRVASGEWLGCYALTEPGAGSDAGSIQTQAKRIGG